MSFRWITLLCLLSPLLGATRPHPQAEDKKPPPAQEQKSQAQVEYEKLFEAGKAAYGKSDLKEAEHLWEEALRIAEQEKWEQEQGTCLFNIARALTIQGDHAMALDHYQRSLKLREKIGNEQDIAMSLNNLGTVYDLLGHYEKALEHFQRSLKLSEKIGNEQDIARSLDNIGNVYDSLGEYPKSLHHYQRSLKLYEEIGNEQDIAMLLSSLGLVYRSLGQYEKALEHSLRSLKLRERIGDQQKTADSLNNVGLIFGVIGQLRKALDHYQRSLKHYEKIGNEEDIAMSLMGIGNVYFLLGQYDKALDHHQHSLKLIEKIGNEQDISGSVNNIGVVYESLGQYEMALDQYQRSLKLRERIGNKRDIADSLNNIGIVYDSLGRYEKALELHRQALKVQEKIGNEDSIATSLGCIGNVYYSLGQNERALDQYQQSLKLREKIGNEPDIAMNLNNIGNVYGSLGQYEVALDYYRRSFKLNEKIGSEQDIALSLDNLGNTYTSLRKHEEAAKSYAEAMKLYEHVSEQVGDPTDVGAFQAASQGSLYERFAALRVKQGNASDALVILERGRAQGLLRQGKSAELDLSGIMALRDLARLRDAEDAAVAANVEYRASVEQLEAATGESKTFFKRQTAEAKEKKEKTQRDWKLIRDSLLANNKAYRNLVKPQHKSIQELRALSKQNPGTVYVEYGQLEDKLLILAMRDGRVPVGMTVSVKEKLLTQKAQKYRQAIQGNEHEELRLAKELYRLAIAPIERKGLLRGGKRIAFVPAGSLLEVPFAALADSKGKRLPERYPVSSAISLSTLLWPDTGRKSTETLLVLADPTGSGGEIAASKTRGALGPLPGARKEGSQIYSLQSGSKKMYTGESAREATTKSEISKYAVLHFACHGSVNSTVPMTSCLYMSPEKSDSAEDGFLEAREIMGIPLSAQLAVLSACETAQGVQSGGEGLMGLVWAFRAAGVPSVVASKWKVDDEATRRIMVKFYKELKRGKRKDDALRAAMLYEMKYPQRTGKSRSIVPIGKGKTRRRSNAYYWAAFQLIGEAGPLRPAK